MNTMTDRDIVQNMLKDSKFALSSMSMALMETTNSQLRNMMTNHFMASITEHYTLSDLAIAKNGYMAHLPTQEQLKNSLANSQQSFNP